MNTLAINESLAEKYPDVGAWEVVGRCMEPDICEGQHVLVSNAVCLEPGRVALFDVGRDMPRLGIVDKVIKGEFVKAYDGLGNSWVALIGDVLGAVVAVV